MENTRILEEILDKKVIDYFNAHSKEYEKQLNEFIKINGKVGIDLAKGNDFSVINGKVIQNQSR